MLTAVCADNEAVDRDLLALFGATDVVGADGGVTFDVDCVDTAEYDNTPGVVTGAGGVCSYGATFATGFLLAVLEEELCEVLDVMAGVINNAAQVVVEGPVVCVFDTGGGAKLISSLLCSDFVVVC